jgi:membrane protein
VAPPARLHLRPAGVATGRDGRGPALTSRVERASGRLQRRLAAARAGWPFLDHALRAYEHYLQVFGKQLAAAITYFGFLSFFPLVALAFALVGYVSAAFPDAQDTVTEALEEALPSLIGSGPGQLNVQDIIDAKAGASLIGLVGLFYAGLGLIDALRDALHRVFGTMDVRLTYVMRKAVDVVVLAALGLALLASLVVSSLATEVTRQSLSLVDLDDSLLAVALLKVLSVALALLADTVLFAILLSRLSGTHLRWRDVRSAAVLGAIGFEVLKLGGSYIIGRITSNPIYATFGFVVGLLIWINLVSQLLIFVAAWGATEAHPTDPAPAPSGTEAVALRRRRWRPAVVGAVVGAGVAAALTRRRHDQ